MDFDFTALASRVATRADVLGCVLLSRDGLVLGAFPPRGERDITPAWVRFAAVGQPERGFVQFQDELWAFVSRGPHSAFVVSTSATRPGILLDLLDQTLAELEETASAMHMLPEHVDLSSQDQPGPAPAPSQVRPPEPGPAHQQHQPIHEPAEAVVQARAAEVAEALPQPFPAPPVLEPVPPLPPEEPSFEPRPQPVPPEPIPLEPVPPEAVPDASPSPEPSAPEPVADPPPADEDRVEEVEKEEEDKSPPGPDPDGWLEVDRVALAREFGQLLQEGSQGDE